MINNINIGSLSFFILIFLSVFSVTTFAQNDTSGRQIYQLKIYHLDNQDQEQRVDQYLENAYIPALHRHNITKVGVFKPLGQDTTSDRRVYVLTPFKSFSQFGNLSKILDDDAQYQSEGSAYLMAAYDNPSFTYTESILLKAFPQAPQIQVPALNKPKAERVYELRSYESPTEALNRNKVKMFNEGGEIEIFDRLGFNAVFYSNVIAGSSMPNLMYMITFESMKSRDNHWETFRNDAQWKKLSAMKKYQNNLSGINNWFLHPTSYSDL